MRPTISKVGFFVFICILALSLTGCDQLTEIYDYFVKKETKESSKEKTQSTVEPKEKSQETPMAPNVLARVGSWTITIDEFEEKLKGVKQMVPDYDSKDLESRALVLEELIRQQLLLIDAEKTGMAKDKAIEEMLEEFRRTLIVREVARRITEKVAYTEQEAKEFYEDNKAQILEPMELTLREIIVSSQLKANEILVEVLKGVDFAEMAKQHSISESAANGGYLGVVPLEEISFAEMFDAVISLEKGEISSVFRGPQGYYIMKVEEKKGGKQIPFDQVKDQIIQNQILMKQQQVLIDYILKLREQISVDVNQNLLRGE